MATLTPDIPSTTAPAPEKAAVPKREYPGALVVVEGIDGSGKSTQLYLLKRWLEINGYRIHFTEWNSSPLVKSATRRGKQRRLLTPVTFSLLHAADFADRCERQIMPLLHGGYLVLADRYIYTAFARDAARDCSPRWLRNLYSFAPVPDITFYFRAPLDVAVNIEVPRDVVLERTRVVGDGKHRDGVFDVWRHLDLMIAGPEGGPSSDMQRYEG